ncbi:MAG: hypothetical protein EU530_07320 [Promethearchaeota archaeon]|nr:MAG: hypothetical protein EU530_07320 [Candidatus Lokiarchaeota archaeon]
MEELIKAKDEQIAKLNNLKDLLKQQILSLQEENTKLKNELFEIEEKIKQLPKDPTYTPDYQSMFNAINAKLTSIVEKLDGMSVEAMVSSASDLTPKSKSKSKPKAVNEEDVRKAEPHPAERGLLKPSSLFSDSDSSPSPQAKEPVKQPVTPAPQTAPSASFHAADPRSLHRQVMEIEYPDTGVIQCPKCNKMEFQEMPEPARGSFAKKYYCKKCRQEWRYLY